MIAILGWTLSNVQQKHRTVTASHNGSNNKQKSQQQQNHRLKTDSSLSHRGLNTFYWYQILALDSAVVDVQEMFNSHENLPLWHLGLFM